MEDKEKEIEKLSGLEYLGRRRAELLYENGIHSLEDIVEEGVDGLTEFPTIGQRTAEKIFESARKEVALDEDDSLDDFDEDLQELEESIMEHEEEMEEEEEIVEETSDDENEEIVKGLEELVEDDEEDLESLADELEEVEKEGIVDELEEIVGTGEEDAEDATEESVGFEEDIESLLPSLQEMDEEEPGPDMKTAKEIDRWLEEKVGIEQHIGEESVCPVCQRVVSIYDDICDNCGVEFVSGEAKCGHCGSEINAEMVECPECGEGLVDEKTLCPICDSVVYSSEDSCPSCGAEFYEDHVRCAECKAKVPINAVVCPECETMLREKIIEEREEETGSMNVRAESTEVDVEKIQLDVSTGYGRSSDEGNSISNAKNDSSQVLYPFPAIVGQERMKRALILNAINPNIGGVLIEGQRGTAKSVAVRGLAEILPPIDVVSDCRFYCDPRKPDEWCFECRDRFEDTSEIPVEEKRVEVVDLPLNATEDRVIGTLDVEKMLAEGVKSFEEGILAEANRGILYVDEINLLDDYIVDVLLDAAAMGKVTVEREGISLTYPSQFRLVGSMNPEEGALRPQLLDRMALNVKVAGLQDAEDRVEIINRRDEFMEDPHAFREKYRSEMDAMRERISGAMKSLENVKITKELDDVIARLSVDFEVDGHRADIIMKRTAMTNAAWEGREVVKTEDVILAAEMALPHRMKKGPLEEKEFDTGKLKRLVKDYTR